MNIIYDDSNPKSSKIFQLLTESKYKLNDLDSAIIVLGGDGFFLNTISKNGLDNVYFPINTGTLGYLLNNISDLSSDSCNTKFNLQLAMHKQVYDFTTLDVKIIYSDNSVKNDIAINDVYVERASGQTARISVDLLDLVYPEQGVNLVSMLSADGIICSTSLGSTAYNYSAGGPILHPLSKSICLTPIAPHKPRLHPIVLSESNIVNIKGQELEKRPIRVVVDGRDYNNTGDKFIKEILVKKYDKNLKVLYFEKHNFLNNIMGMFC